jgi:hypothetical protein
VDTIAARLLEANLLTRDASSGWPAEPVGVPHASGLILEFYGAVLPKPRGADWIIFIGAWLAARYMLWRWPLRRIVNRVAQRKHSHESSRERVRVEDVRRLIGLYIYMRPFVYTRKEKCLLDNLTLVEFLAAAGVFPDWVIGVRTRPFAAHTWLQMDGNLLNDSPGRIGFFTPILVT